MSSADPSPAPRAQSSTQGRLLSIQYLRAFAALVVVAYHAMRWTKPTFEIGAAGVDIFFVISGFILWTIASERPVTPQIFLARRWIRVAPLYWLLTLVVAALAWRWPPLIWDAKVDLRHLLLSLAFVQHLNADGQPFPIITAGWSLNYEALFYVIFAASLWAPVRFRLELLTAGLLAVPVFGFFVPPAYFLGANMMFLQFIAGVWLAQARLKRNLPKGGAGWALAGLGLVVFALFYRLGLFENLWRPLLWGAPALLLVAGLVTAETNGGLPDIAAFRLLGDASYSIYLAHVVIIELLSHVFNSGHLSFIPISMAISVLGGLATYYGLERPLIGLFRRRRTDDPPVYIQPS